jgi:hypothetical protein
VAEWLRSGLQSRLHRFDSGRRLWTQSGIGTLARGRVSPMSPHTGNGRPRYDPVVWCDDCVHGRHDPQGGLGRDGRRVGGYDTLE